MLAHHFRTRLPLGCLILGSLAGATAGQEPLFDSALGIKPLSNGGARFVADQDGDGDLDLLWFSGAFATGAKGMRWLINDGAGGFDQGPATIWSSATSSNPSNKPNELADFNGDGFLDMASGHFSFPFDGVEVYWGGPGGTFTKGDLLNLGNAAIWLLSLIHI